MSTARANLRIKGRVQGVFFRQSAKEEAERLGLTGWVKNLHSGDVEAVVEGDPLAVERFTAWCHRGPPAAQVVEVEAKRAPPTGEFTTFGVER